MENDVRRLKIAGVLQILFGAFGIGRLSLLHITRTSIHCCLTVLGIFCLGLSDAVAQLTAVEPTMLILLNPNFSATLYNTLGIVLLCVSIGGGILDGVFLLFSSDKKTTSCCLGFFGWIGISFLFLVGVVGVSATALNIDLFVRVATSGDPEVITKENTYISQVDDTTFSITTDMDADYLVICFYAINKNSLELEILYYVTFTNVEANKPYEFEYTLEYDEDLYYDFDYEVMGLLFTTTNQELS